MYFFLLYYIKKKAKMFQLEDISLRPYGERLLIFTSLSYFVEFSLNYQTLLTT